MFIFVTVKDKTFHNGKTFQDNRQVSCWVKRLMLLLPHAALLSKMYLVKDTLKAFGNVIVALHNEFEGIFFIYFKFTPVFF